MPASGNGILRAGQSLVQEVGSDPAVVEESIARHSLV